MQNVTRRQFLAGLAALAAIAMTPEPAEAMPAKFRKCESVTQNGVRYLLWKHCAIVTKCAPRKSVTIPRRIKHAGHTYTVTAIWDGAISKKTRRVVIKARNLDTIEDYRIETGRVQVIYK